MSEGTGGGVGPMQMMQKMMAQMGQGGMDPAKMCKMMTTSVTQAAEIATYATPELRALFDDWVRQVREELVAKVALSPEGLDLDALAAQMDLNADSVAFLVGTLAREGKFRVTVSPAGAANEDAD